MLTANGSLLAAATSELLVAGTAEAVGRFFTEDYVAHVTENDVRGGHELIPWNWAFHCLAGDDH